MQQGQWDWAGIYFACIFLFALGTVAALFMIQKLGKRAQHVFLLTFVAAFVLVDGLALALHQDRSDGERYNVHASLASSLAAFALGSQNLLSQKSGVVKANTTFMTGNIQKMAEAVWSQCTKKGGLSASEKRAAVLLFCTWLPYVLGGVCGAALATTTDWSLTPAALLYVVGMYSMQVEGVAKGAGFLLCCAPPAAVPTDVDSGKSAAEAASLPPVVSETKSTTVVQEMMPPIPPPAPAQPAPAVDLVVNH